jgi:hypothetical protein
MSPLIRAIQTNVRASPMLDDTQGICVYVRNLPDARRTPHYSKPLRSLRLASAWFPPNRRHHAQGVTNQCSFAAWPLLADPGQFETVANGLHELFGNMEGNADTSDAHTRSYRNGDNRTEDLGSYVWLINLQNNSYIVRYHGQPLVVKFLAKSDTRSSKPPIAQAVVPRRIDPPTASRYTTGNFIPVACMEAMGAGQLAQFSS